MAEQVPPGAVWNDDGLPQNMKAVAADALEWMLLLQRKWSTVDGGVEWKAENRRKLIEAIAELRRHLYDAVAID